MPITAQANYTALPTNILSFPLRREESVMSDDAFFAIVIRRLEASIRDIAGGRLAFAICDVDLKSMEKIAKEVCAARASTSLTPKMKRVLLWRLDSLVVIRERAQDLLDKAERCASLSCFEGSQ